MTLRGPIARARGLGSAREGVGHWWAQRLTAVALVPLGVWFVVSLVSLVGAGHAEVAAWLSAPVTAVLMILLIVALFHHSQLGLQVVIEDYVGGEGMRILSLIVMKFVHAVLALIAVFAVLRIAFGG